MISASGGSDSTALLLGLKLLNEDFNNLTVIHVNHKLRDIESEEDALFLKQLCDSLGYQETIKNNKVKLEKNRLYLRKIKDQKEQISNKELIDLLKKRCDR